MDKFIQDLRYAARSIIKNPSFAVVAIAALAIGIGANTAIFSVINSVLLKPLPYNDPQKLVMIWQDHRARGGPEQEWPTPSNFKDWRDQSRAFDHVVAMVGWGPTLTGDSDPQDLIAAGVSYDTFATLGVQPVLGRDFREEEDKAGAERVVILSNRLWKRNFGSDTGVIGRSIALSGESFTVIGVMPESFRFPIKPEPELFRTVIPVIPAGCQRDCSVLRVIGRIKSDATLESARADMSVLAASLAQLYPDANTGVGSTIVPLKEQIVGNQKPMFFALLGAVGLVLLIACANVANLQLARASSREREMAIRAALGAGRSRIVRQLMTESVLLAATGGALGLMLAYWLVDGLVALSPPGIPRLEEIRIDSRVLLFTFSTAVLTGLLFGLAPALRGSRTDLGNTLREGKGSSGVYRGHKLRAGLVVAEVSLALVVMTAAGLLVNSFVRLLSVDPGFKSAHILTASIVMPRARYPKDEQARQFHERLLDRLKALPDVESAGAILNLPLNGNNTDTNFVIEGRPRPAPGQRLAAWYSSVTTGYFDCMGIKLIRGRGFTDQDKPDGPQVVVVSESFARRFFGDEDGVGKRIGTGRDDKPTWREIVGVVGDVKHFALELDMRPNMYFPHSQISSRRMSIVLRVKGDPRKLTNLVRAELNGIDNQLALSSVQTMDEIVSSSVATQRFTLLLFALFAVIALLLVIIGIYGVISYAVSQRTHELGIRMALGADRSSVLRLVLGQGMALSGAGVGLGLAVSIALTRLMRSLLFQVSPTDVLTFSVISLFLITAALVACLIPARRATRVDPMVALRCE